MYGGRWILKGVDLSLEPGSIAVLEGPNGSGKTTLLRIIAGLVQPSRGQVTVACKRCIGYVGHQPLLYRDLTVEENLRFYAGALMTEEWITGSRIWRLLGLEEYRRRRVEELSYGWKKRADLARALLSRPRILLVDEPFTGLDEEARSIVAVLLREIASRKGAVLATTPRMDEDYSGIASVTLRLRGGRIELAQ